MPELPEVETIRADLDPVLRGRRIVAAEGLGARTLRRHPDPATALGDLTGAVVGGVGRRGKYLVVRTDSGPDLVVHLGMSGQLSVGPGGASRPRHTHVTLALDDGREVRFVDPRTFGEVFLSEPDGTGTPPELAHLGPDAWPDPPTTTDLAALLAGRRTGCKALLLDQRRLAGIGNLYADEILWTAQLHPAREAATLGRPEIARLRAAMVAVLDEAVAHRGSSLADEQYRDLSGRVGGYQHHHRAYGRTGLPCPRCGRPIRRVLEAGRGTHFCSSCQRLPRRREGLRGPGPPPARVRGGGGRGR